ncbi:hypothetical protein MKX03_019132 [Papaver bracteatum]|nr:hypothetical protein MKX03_019132 [Papaver bracteatum]
MATYAISFRPVIKASSSGGNGKADLNKQRTRASPPSSANWWTPISGYANRFMPGCFTEEKPKQLRIKAMESANFHDIMYHSAIASRLDSCLVVFFRFFILCLNQINQNKSTLPLKKKKKLIAVLELTGFQF